jgi:hypothetical protein
MNLLKRKGKLMNNTYSAILLHNLVDGADLLSVPLVHGFDISKDHLVLATLEVVR